MNICPRCQHAKSERREMIENPAKSNEFETWRLCPSCGYEAAQPTGLRKATWLAPAIGVVALILTGVWIG